MKYISDLTRKLNCLVVGLLLAGSIYGLDCSGSRACNPCGGRKSPELNRDYYIPPHKITWRHVSEEELKENDRKMTQSFVYTGKGTQRVEEYPHSRVQVGDGGRPYARIGEESPTVLPGRRRSSSATTTLSDSGSDSSDTQDLDRPTTLCDRLRLSLAGICTQSKWVWTYPTRELSRQTSFVDSEQPGLSQRIEVIDMRKRSVVPVMQPLEKKSKTATPGSLYPYTTATGGQKMVTIAGNNKPYATKRSSRSKG